MSSSWIYPVPCGRAEQIISATVSRNLQLFLQEPAPSRNHSKHKRICSHECFWYSASWFSVLLAKEPTVWSLTSTAPAWEAHGPTVMQMYPRAPYLKVEAASTLLTHRPSILPESRNFGSSSKTNLWALVSPSMRFALAWRSFSGSWDGVRKMGLWQTNPQGLIAASACLRFLLTMLAQISVHINLH